jgi:succinate dehydrogenase (ubiquinone) cytochrome b560 subunit
MTRTASLHCVVVVRMSVTNLHRWSAPIRPSLNNANLYLAPVCTLLPVAKPTHRCLPARTTNRQLLVARHLTAATTRTKPELQVISVSEHNSRLATQRLRRPISPHLSIYRPQTQWISGALMRNSAILITAPVYLFGAAYLVSPMLGWHLDIASLVDWFGSLAPSTRVAVKGVFAWPLCFHLVHGLKHLIWDTGAMLGRKQFIMSGWVGLGLSTVMAVGLVLL